VQLVALAGQWWSYSCSWSYGCSEVQQQHQQHRRRLQLQVVERVEEYCPSEQQDDARDKLSQEIFPLALQKKIDIIQGIMANAGKAK
jgi:hypothetical protein